MRKLILFSLILLNLSFSTYLYLEFSIDKNFNVSLSTFYFLDNANESYEKYGNIEIRVLDQSGRILKTVYSNFSENEFIIEYFSPTKGRVVTEEPFIIKSVIFEFPDNSSKIQIYVNNEIKEEFLASNNSLIKPNNLSIIEKEEVQRNQNNFLFYILIALAVFGLIFIILKKSGKS